MALLMSRVNTPEARPYSVSFALRSTSSTSLGFGERGQRITLASQFIALLQGAAARHSCDDSPVLELGHHHDRPKGLLFGDEHVVLDISEHGRLHEET